MSQSSGGLLGYIIMRLLMAIPMVIILLTVVFMVMRVVPGDPATAMLGPKASPGEIARLKAQLGLNQPIYLQYVHYMEHVLTGNLGVSFRFRSPVWGLIKPRLMATMELVFYAFIVAIVVGIAIGVFSANRRGTLWDFGGDLYGIVVYAFPIFWLGMMLQLLLAVKLHWVPTSGRFPGNVSLPPTITGWLTIDALLSGQWHKFLIALHYLALPAGTLGVYMSGIFARMTRTNMLQTLKSEFVEAARARGIKERWVTWHHAFKNALVPVITVLGLQFALSLAGAALTEQTFNWPGLAKFLVHSILERDYPTVQGIITVFAILVVAVSLVIDVINAAIDPRIRY